MVNTTKVHTFHAQSLHLFLKEVKFLLRMRILVESSRMIAIALAKEDLPQFLKTSFEKVFFTYCPCDCVSISIIKLHIALRCKD